MVHRRVNWIQSAVWCDDSDKLSLYSSSMGSLWDMRGFDFEWTTKQLQLSLLYLNSVLQAMTKLLWESAEGSTRLEKNDFPIQSLNFKLMTIQLQLRSKCQTSTFPLSIRTSFFNSSPPQVKLFPIRQAHSLSFFHLEICNNEKFLQFNFPNSIKNSSHDEESRRIEFAWRSKIA